MSFIRAYLRASTKEQDAERARAQLEGFVAEKGLKIAAWYVENESGSTLKRPELQRLLNDCQDGDVLLLEQVDRLSRLNDADWKSLKQEITNKGVRIVALDLPTSYQSIATTDETTARILVSVNEMLLDMLAAIARKDYNDRKRRQAQGIVKAKEQGKFKGKQVNKERHARIAKLLDAGLSWSEVCAEAECSRSTIKRVVDAQKEMSNV